MKLNVLFIATLLLNSLMAVAQRQMENLGRGMVAINQGKGKVYVGWRLLATDPDDVVMVKKPKRALLLFSSKILLCSRFFLFLSKLSKATMPMMLQLPI
jgi:hypothetical protein